MNIVYWKLSFSPTPSTSLAGCELCLYRGAPPVVSDVCRSYSPLATAVNAALLDYHPYQNHTWTQLHDVVVEKVCYSIELRGLSDLNIPPSQSQEYQLECYKDDLQRLSVYESESKRKDQVILALRKDIAEYKKCTQSRDSRLASLQPIL